MGLRAIVSGLKRAAVSRVFKGAEEERRLGRYARQWVLPHGLTGDGAASYVPALSLEHEGIELNDAEQLQRLRRWQASYQGLFELVRKDPCINTRCPGREYLLNGHYPTPDAEIYAAMILDFRPQSIVEVGAGFSTLVARTAIRQLGGGCTLTVVDPEPRTDIRQAADTVITSAVEAVSLADMAIGPRGVLFVDSSHITRARGDIPFLFNELIPSLPAGTLVHVHDIFLPFDYPPLYQARLYTEQYVLQALLSHSVRYEVLFATHYMARTHRGEMQAAFGEIVGRDDAYFGASFWFAVR